MKTQDWKHQPNFVQEIKQTKKANNNKTGFIRKNRSHDLQNPVLSWPNNWSGPQQGQESNRVFTGMSAQVAIAVMGAEPKQDKNIEFKVKGGTGCHCPQAVLHWQGITCKKSPSPSNCPMPIVHVLSACWNFIWLEFAQALCVPSPACVCIWAIALQCTENIFPCSDPPKKCKVG